MTEVLITDGNRRPALAVARSLAKQGVSVLVVSDERRSLAFSSRHVNRTELVPSPTAQPGAFCDRLLELIRRDRIELVIPVLEESLLAIDPRRDEFEAVSKLAASSSGSLRKVLDKRINLRIARELGIDCPAQYEVQSLDQLPELIDALGFPMVLKPPGSPNDLKLPSFPFKVLYANDESQLREYIRHYCPDGVFPMFQECVFGESRNLCCLVCDGEVVAMHEYRSLRRLKGHGVLREIVPITARAAQDARAMFRALQWNGVAQFCFFVEPETGRVRYMETNGRFWSSVAGSVHASWDFPYWVYRYFQHGERPEPTPIEMGSKTCWHRGDLVALINYLAGGEAPGHGSEPGSLRAVADYLGGFRPSIHADVFEWGDPLPGFVDHWQLLGRALTVIRKKGVRQDPNRVSAPKRE